MSDSQVTLGIEDVMDMYNEDIANGGIRELNDYERRLYGGVVMRATQELPFFADAFAIISPFMDATADTAYTDEDARAGFGYWFFYVIDIQTRMTWLTHEAMHVLNNHFVRGSSLGITGERTNKVGDLEINTSLQTVPSMNLEGLLLPELYDLPKMKTMELYNTLIDEAINNEMNSDSPGADDKNESDKSDSDDNADNGSESGDEADSGSSKSGKGQGSGEGADEGSGEGADEGADKGTGEASDKGSGKDSGEGSDEGSGEGSGEDSGEGSGGGSGQGSGKGSSGEGSGAGSGKDKQGAPGNNDDSAQTQEKRLRRDIENKKFQAPPGTRSCDPATQSRSALADKAGVEKVSPLAQNIARNNTKARMVEHMNSTKTRGTGASNEFLQVMISRMAPPKVNWRELFRRAASNACTATMAGRSEPSYKRVNRRYSQGAIIFPGTIDRMPRSMIAVDTSGSMGQNDYKSVLSEIAGILQSAGRSRDGVRAFCVDTEVKNIQPVNAVEDLSLVGGGGTDMDVAFAYANSLSKKDRPDIFVLGTDGHLGTNWNAVYEEVLKSKYVSIILVSTPTGYASAPEKLRRVATVIDISETSSN